MDERQGGYPPQKRFNGKKLVFRQDDRVQFLWWKADKDEYETHTGTIVGRATPDPVKALRSFWAIQLDEEIANFPYRVVVIHNARHIKYMEDVPFEEYEYE